MHDSSKIQPCNCAFCRAAARSSSMVLTIFTATCMIAAIIACAIFF